MKPAKSPGHRLARRSFIVTLVLAAALLFRIAVFALTGSAGAFTAPLGVILIVATVAAAGVTVLLYILMFTVYMSDRRDRRRGHVTTTGRGSS